MVPWAPLGMQPSLMVPEGSIKLVHQGSRLNTRDQVASSIKRGKNVVHMSKNDPADLTLKTHEQHVDLDIGELRNFGTSRLVLHNSFKKIIPCKEICHQRAVVSFCEVGQIRLERYLC